jgi:DNA sulfur modification protein DndE
MKAPVETVRISAKGRDTLINAKRKTGVEQWNVLCRWALCASLSIDSAPKPAKITEDSNIEIAWKVFSGGFGEIFSAALRSRFGRDTEMVKYTPSEHFRAHLERGISYLQNVKNLEHLCSWHATTDR